MSRTARGFPGPPTSPSGGLPRASGSGWPATSRARPSAMSFIRPQQPPEPHHSRRRPPVGGIDLHAHLAPSIDPSGPGLRGIGTAEDGRLTEDGSPLGPVPLYRPEQLTAYLDRADLDQAVVSIP